MKSIIVGGIFILGIVIPTLPTLSVDELDREKVKIELYDTLNLPSIECTIDASPEEIRQNYEQFALECINRSHKWFII
jgi:hypothetical protein